jgi:hypothetical protein
MDFAEPSHALNDVERLRRTARSDRRPSSVPLLVFGVLTLGSAPFAEDISLWRLFYWAAGGPAGLLAVAWWSGGVECGLASAPVGLRTRRRRCSSSRLSPSSSL